MAFIGDIIRNYKVIDIVNEGASNSYFVLDGSVKYFMKEYKDPSVIDPKFREFYANQETLINILNSMGSVTEKFVCHFEEKGIYYQIKEILHGVNLVKWCEENGDYEKRKTVSILLCGIIKNIHTHGIVHQDLKPAQVMLVDDEIGKRTKLGYRITLSDFDWSIPNGKMVKLVGTQGYKSPEHYKAEQPTEKSDIFTLGVIINELLTGLSPYDFDDVISDDVLKQRVLTKKCQIPKKQNPEISEELNTIILKSLEVNPDNRPTLDELQNALFDRKDKFAQFSITNSGKSFIVYSSSTFGRKQIKDFFADINDSEGNLIYKYCDEAKPMLYFEKRNDNTYYMYASEGTKNYFLLNEKRITTTKMQLNKGDKLSLYSSAKTKTISDFEIK